MITIEHLKTNPQKIKYLVGIPANLFWQLVQEAEGKYPSYREERLKQKENRKRNVGGGAKNHISLAVRILAHLMYIRLHVHQRVVAALVDGISQSKISRDLRELPPLLHELLPVPELWQPGEGPCRQLTSEELPEHEGILDAVEQPVYRSQDNETQEAYYSGKKQQHTLKSQVLTDTEHEIKAISSAVPGSVHDKKLADSLGTIERMPDDSDLLGDKAYVGLDKEVGTMEAKLDEGIHGQVQAKVPRMRVITPSKKPKGGELSDDEKMMNGVISSLRIRVEHCIGWIKNFKICDTRFRCCHSVYTPIFRLVCGLVNLQTHRWKESKVNATC